MQIVLVAVINLSCSDCPADYVPPFHGHMPSDPSLECMVQVVVERGIQPTIPATWWEDKVGKRINVITAHVISKS